MGFKPSFSVEAITGDFHYCKHLMCHKKQSIWTCVEFEYRLCWKKCSCNNHFCKTCDQERQYVSRVESSVEVCFWLAKNVKQNQNMSTEKDNLLPLSELDNYSIKTCFLFPNEKFCEFGKLGVQEVLRKRIIQLPKNI